MERFAMLAGSAAYAGVLWRMRGGAFAGLTGYTLGGTQATRALFAFVFGFDFGGPALLRDAILALAIFAGLVLTGWEEFDEMGLETGAIAHEKLGYWMRWLPTRMGLTIDTVPYDLIGMAQAGLVCVAPAAFLAFWFSGLLPALVILLAGLGFGPAYLLARLPLPNIANFAVGQQWGEVFAGAVLGVALMFAFGVAG